MNTELKLDKNDIGQILRCFNQHGVALNAGNRKIGEIFLLRAGENMDYIVFSPIGQKQHDDFKDGFIIQHIYSLGVSELIVDNYVTVDYVKKVLNHYFKLQLV